MTKHEETIANGMWMISFMVGIGAAMISGHFYGRVVGWGTVFIVSPLVVFIQAVYLDYTERR